MFQHMITHWQKILLPCFYVCMLIHIEGVMRIRYLLLIFPDGKGDWVSDGCINKSRNLDTIVCECNHLSMFGVLVVSMCVCVYCITEV